MSETIKLQQDNWGYLQENNFFKSEEEDATMFRWVSRLGDMNRITNKEGKTASFYDLVELSTLDPKETKKFLNRLINSGIMGKFVGEQECFILNPNLAFATYDKEHFRQLHLLFSLCGTSRISKNLPVSIWDMDLSEY
ncbi:MULTISPECIES: hypothetical protein [Bacillus cereus group]|uniref:hypothetical protein n=1 Tax=Bacillus cereus group TaxID=86661 RepID=UPI0021D2565D|nr:MULTISPECIES: hypothetical protein [Bacillus cereus group]MCU5201642.1 hypothetical protein [Bacillus paranthracis]MCU5374722.1 hypothetical protein [Bacillus pacificus]